VVLAGVDQKIDAVCGDLDSRRLHS
jgi:hypothetical protein